MVSVWNVLSSPSSATCPALFPLSLAPPSSPRPHALGSASFSFTKGPFSSAALQDEDGLQTELLNSSLHSPMTTFLCDICLCFSLLLQPLATPHAPVWSLCNELVPAPPPDSPHPWSACPPLPEKVSKTPFDAGWSPLQPFRGFLWSVVPTLCWDHVLTPSGIQICQGLLRARPSEQQRATRGMSPPFAGSNTSQASNAGAPPFPCLAFLIT